MKVSKILIPAAALTIFLTGCAPQAPKAPVGVYQCSYKNTATKHIYYANDPRQFVAVKVAYDMCQKGPVNTECYFRFCQQIK